MRDEGVIKFRQEFIRADPPKAVDLLELCEWRDRLRQWDLIGVYPDGIGYGNVSCRLPPFDAAPGARAFVISGTQTGRDDYLERARYATVVRYDVAANTVVCAGAVPASSESMTHGTLYDLDDALRYIFHVHCPAMWRRRAELRLPTTSAAVPYGTPDMAREVQRLFRETDVAAVGVFAMGGHEDGVVSFGRTAVETGSRLRTYLTRARGD